MRLPNVFDGGCGEAPAANETAGVVKGADCVEVCPPGSRGGKGTKGDKGDTGNDGVDGAKGDQGDPGPNLLPLGGTTDQALRKVSNADYDMAWEDVHEVPTGGTSGQALRKNSSTNYDVSFLAVHEVPAGGTRNSFLSKASDTDYDLSWFDPTYLDSFLFREMRYNSICTASGQVDTWGDSVSNYGTLDTAAATVSNLSGASQVNSVNMASANPANGGFNDSWAVAFNLGRRADQCRRFGAFVRVATAASAGRWFIGLTKWAANSGGQTFYGGQLVTDTLALGCAFWLNTGTMRWHLKTSDGLSETSVDTGVAYADKQVWFELRMDVANGVVNAYIDNVLVANSVTNLPAASDSLFVSVGGRQNGVTVGTKGLYVATIKLLERIPF